MSRNQQFFAAAFSLAFVAGAARAQSEASTLCDVSGLPIASLAGASAAAPAGAAFIVKSVEATAYTTMLRLERTSDGADMTVRIGGRAVKQTSVLAGTTLTATAISTGTVLMTDRQAVAFVPNALGAALMRRERIAI